MAVHFCSRWNLFVGFNCNLFIKIPYTGGFIWNKHYIYVYCQLIVGVYKVIVCEWRHIYTFSSTKRNQIKFKRFIMSFSAPMRLRMFATRSVRFFFNFARNWHLDRMSLYVSLVCICMAAFVLRTSQCTVNSSLHELLQ